VPPVPKERKKRSYIEICYEKGWDIGIVSYHFDVNLIVSKLRTKQF
jgi:hypothetical protein